MMSEAVMSDRRQRLSDSWARSAKIAGYKIEVEGVGVVS